MTRLFTVLLVVLLLSPLSMASNQTRLSVIPLHHRPADTLILPLKKITQKNEVITAAGNQLIIKASVDRTEEIIAIIKRLDLPLAQFEIQVKQDQQGQGQSSEAGVNWQGAGTVVHSGGLSTGTYTLDGRPVSRSGDSNHEVTVKRETRNYSSNTVQKLRATEDYPAFIKAGADIPYSLKRETLYGQVSSQEFKEVVSGFYVTAINANSDGVTLSIRTRDDRASENDNSIDINHSSSHVYAPYDQWVAIGSNQRDGDSTETGIARYQSNNSEKGHRVYVKIIRK